MVSTIIILFGIYCIIDANSYKDERSEVITRVSLGIVIISATIINFIFYIKRNLKDFNPVIREENKKRTMQIGEILQLIIFSIFLFAPIINIPNFLGILSNKKELIIQILKSFAISISAFILLYNLNPLNIKNKMKKFLPKIIFALIICFIIFRIYNLIVLINYSKSIAEYDKYNYSKVTHILSENNLTFITELSKNDNVHCQKSTNVYNGTKNISFVMFDLENKNEFYNCYSIEDNTVSLSKWDSKTIEKQKEESINDLSTYDYVSKLKFDWENKSWANVLKDIILYPVTYVGEYNGTKCKIIVSNFGNYEYINKETNIAMGTVFYSNGEKIAELIYEFGNNIPEDMKSIPDISGYKVIEYSDVRSSPVEDLAEPDLAISNTNLKPGETLIENIDLLPDEELNFLNLSGDLSGIKKIQVENLETYNKFKEKYSNLRELTEDDLKRYEVFLVYKEGYKLNYKKQYESKNALEINYIVEEEKIDGENVLLVISKRYGRKLASFIETSEEIQIDSETAFNILEDNIEKLEKEYNLEDYSLGMRYDYLEILDNETLSKMNYIQTPIEEKELVCWVIGIYIRDENNKLYVYIDSVTGNLIGSIMEKN